MIVEAIKKSLQRKATTFKTGGYATYCKSGITILDAGYKFVMQISSDDKAKFNIIDSGLFFFYYNKDKNDWKVYCDFY